MISFSRPYGWFSTRIRRSSLTTSRSVLNVSSSMRSVAMPIGFEPQHERQVLRRHRLPEHRRVFGRVGVALAADARDVRRVPFGLDVLRALEHHVLEQVREPGAARLLVLRADVIPDLGVHDRRRVIFEKDDLQPVGQRRHRVVELAAAARPRRAAATISDGRAGQPHEQPAATDRAGIAGCMGS